MYPDKDRSGNPDRRNFFNPGISGIWWVGYVFLDFSSAYKKTVFVRSARMNHDLDNQEPRTE